VISASAPATEVAAPAGGRADLRAIVADGVFFSAMVGVGETYVPAFALAAGLGEVVAGLVATLPMLAGAIFQLATPWGVRRMRSYRRWVVTCACLQALSFVPLVVGAVLGKIGLPWLAASTMAYWGFGMATSPAWNAWVTTLVPREARARFFANRARICQASLFATVLTGGLLLHWGRGEQTGLAIFGLLFAIALCARSVSAWFLGRQSELPGLAERHQTLRPAAMLESIRMAGSGRVLVYLLVMQAVVNVASPFFTPYMLGPLDLSYARFMFLTASAFLARVAILPLLGRVAEVGGVRLLLWWGAVGIVPLPALWLVSDAFPYLLALQLLSGFAWAALELATLLSFFEGIRESDRASVLTAFNVVNAAAIGLGSVVGGWLFSILGAQGLGYLWLFVLSSLGRLGALAVLRGTVPAKGMLHVELRTLAVRPSAGAVQRPMLASGDARSRSESGSARRGGEVVLDERGSW
jgi:MFS family permease